MSKLESFDILQEYRDLCATPVIGNKDLAGYRTRLCELYWSGQVRLQMMVIQFEDIMCFRLPVEKMYEDIFDTIELRVLNVAINKRVQEFWDSYDLDSRLDSITTNTLFNDLTSTIKDLQEMRILCITDWKFDTMLYEPHEFPPTTLSIEETSDSYDPDDDNDHWYHLMRQDLELFRQDEAGQWLKTGPIFDARMRRDIRAWTRLANYRCMRLACWSMLIHKDKTQLPRRPKKKHNDPQSRISFGDDPQRSNSCSHAITRDSGI